MSIDLTSPNSFCWATGIENTFIPQTRAGLRSLDEYELTQHYTHWKTDFDLVAETGVTHLRWGIPWYKVQPKPDEWDWRWVDDALEYLVVQKNITPILDLMHYGTPVWLANSFINARYAEHVAEYAGTVAARYKSLVRNYTPFNEPMMAAQLCGRQGLWPPYLLGDDGYYKVVAGVAKGMVLTVQAILSEQPDAKTVQVEALWRNWVSQKTTERYPALAERVYLGQSKKYLAWDLCTGRVTPDHPLLATLRQYGFHDCDFEWFHANAVSFDVFGANFYPWSYGELAPTRDGQLRRRPAHTPGTVLAEVLEEAYHRYHLPVMVTETSSTGEWAVRKTWMDETIQAVGSLCQRGVPVTGYTWFPFMTMIGWEYRLGNRILPDYLLHLGLYDLKYQPDGMLERQATPLVSEYRRYTAQPFPPYPEDRGG